MAKSWIFQSNPDRYDIIDTIRTLSETTWIVSRYRDDIEVGDRVFLWKAGDAAGIYGCATIAESSRSRSSVPWPDRRWRDPSQEQSAVSRCLIRIDSDLTDRAVLRTELVKQGLGDLQVIKAPQGTNFKVTADQRGLLDAIVPCMAPEGGT